jgi:hypothetical protein
VAGLVEGAPAGGVMAAQDPSGSLRCCRRPSRAVTAIWAGRRPSRAGRDHVRSARSVSAARRDRSVREASRAPRMRPARRASRARHLLSGMVTRTVIGQAEGILMERLKVTADQAFGVLSRLSQAGNGPGHRPQADVTVSEAGFGGPAQQRRPAQLLDTPCHLGVGVRVPARCERVGRFRSAGSARLESRVAGHPFAGDHMPAGRDMASERITWETCPHCGLTAAVGWLDEVPDEFDCTGGCAPTEQDLGRLRRAAGGSSSLGRGVDATWRSR